MVLLRDAALYTGFGMCRVLKRARVQRQDRIYQGRTYAPGDFIDFLVHLPFVLQAVPILDSCSLSRSDYAQLLMCLGLPYSNISIVRTGQDESGVSRE